METIGLKEIEISSRISHWEKGKVAARGTLPPGKRLHAVLTTPQTTLQDAAEAQMSGLVVGGTAVWADC